MTSMFLKSPMSGTFTSVLGIYRISLRMSDSTDTRKVVKRAALAPSMTR
jgi:hypothetical protein